MVTAARAEALWENDRADHGAVHTCGRAACCAKSKGWGWQWTGDAGATVRTWAHVGGQRQMEQPDIAHVLLRCCAVPGARRERDALRDAIRRARAMATRKTMGVGKILFRGVRRRASARVSLVFMHACLAVVRRELAHCRSMWLVVCCSRYQVVIELAAV